MLAMIPMAFVFNCGVWRISWGPASSNQRIGCARCNIAVTADKDDIGIMSHMSYGPRVRLNNGSGTIGNDRKRTLIFKPCSVLQPCLNNSNLMHLTNLMYFTDLVTSPQLLRLALHRTRSHLVPSAGTSSSHTCFLLPKYMESHLLM